MFIQSCKLHKLYLRQLNRGACNLRIQDIPYLPTYGSQIGYIRPIGRSKTVRVASRGAAPFGLPPAHYWPSGYAT